MNPVPEAKADPAPSAAAVRAVWWCFGPPAVLAGLRAWLQWEAERHPRPPAWRMAEVPPPQAGVFDLLLPWLAGLAAVLVAVGVLVAIARRGPAAAAGVRRFLLALWVAVCAAGCVALWLSDANLRGLQPQPPTQAQVLGHRGLAPNMHSTANLELVLRVDGFPTPLQARIDHPDTGQWTGGQRLELQWARGRWFGQYATGWQLIMAP